MRVKKATTFKSSAADAVARPPSVRRGRGRPRRAALDWSASPCPPQRPRGRARSYDDAVYRFGELYELCARENEGKPPSRWDGRAALRLAAADVLAHAAMEPDRDKRTGVTLPENLIDLDAARERLLWLRDKAALPRMTAPRRDFIIASAWRYLSTHRHVRGTPLAYRSRLLAWFGAMLDDLRVEYARARDARGPLFVKAERHVLAGGDKVPVAEVPPPWDEDTPLSQINALEAQRRDFDRAVASYAAEAQRETLDQRIERTYLLWIAYDRARSELRREPEAKSESVRAILWPDTNRSDSSVRDLPEENDEGGIGVSSDTATRSVIKVSRPIYDRGVPAHDPVLRFLLSSPRQAPNRWSRPTSGKPLRNQQRGIEMDLIRAEERPALRPRNEEAVINEAIAYVANRHGITGSLKDKTTTLLAVPALVAEVRRRVAATPAAMIKLSKSNP